MNIDTVAVVLATAIGPIAAVLITLWYQGTSQRQAAKERVFYSLMAHRKANPPTFEWANSLNLIDVVYADRPAIVQLWHELYDILQRTPLNNQQYAHKYLELLSAMAQSLGYHRLTQTDIDKFYSPQVHGDIAQLNAGIQLELLRVLRASERLSVVPRKDGSQ
jgi:hypothetical protein